MNTTHPTVRSRWRDYRHKALEIPEWWSPNPLSFLALLIGIRAGLRDSVTFRLL